MPCTRQIDAHIIIVASKTIIVSLEKQTLHSEQGVYGRSERNRYKSRDVYGIVTIKDKQ